MKKKTITIDSLNEFSSPNFKADILKAIELEVEDSRNNGASIDIRSKTVKDVERKKFHAKLDDLYKLKSFVYLEKQITPTCIDHVKAVVQSLYELDSEDRNLFPNVIFEPFSNRWISLRSSTEDLTRAEYSDMNHFLNSISHDISYTKPNGEQVTGVKWSISDKKYNDLYRG